MRTINEIASWYKKNNQLSSDELRIEVLSLYTIVAYNVKGIELSYGELKVNNLSIDIGITNTNIETNFSEEEIRILNTINRLYGYLKVSTLLYSLGYAGNTIEKIITSLKDEISNDLDSYKDYDFNEYTVMYGKNIFFVDNNTNLTEEEYKHLKKYDTPYQNQFTVFRDEQTGKLVIY